MKITCNLTSTGPALVIPPSPHSTLILPVSPMGDLDVGFLKAKGFSPLEVSLSPPAAPQPPSPSRVSPSTLAPPAPFITSMAQGRPKRKWTSPEIDATQKVVVLEDSNCTTTNCIIRVSSFHTDAEKPATPIHDSDETTTDAKSTADNLTHDKHNTSFDAIADDGLDKPDEAESAHSESSNAKSGEAELDKAESGESESKPSHEISFTLMDTYGGSLLDDEDSASDEDRSMSDADGSESESESDESEGDDVINKFLVADGADFRPEDEMDRSGASQDGAMITQVSQDFAYASAVYVSGIDKHGVVDEWTEEKDKDGASEAGKVVEDEFNPYIFIKHLPARVPGINPAPPLLPPLAEGDHPFCLVLDLDETLVHCSTEPLSHPDLVFPVTFNAVEYTVFARKRPHIHEFLSRVSAMFEVVVFTASQEVYADKLLNILDPERKFIKHRLFRDSCVCLEGNYIKDLTMLGRDLAKVIIVDNSPQAFGYHIDNGIPIESWFDNDKDTELQNVSTFLETLLTSNDVRPLIREKYKLHEIGRAHV